MMITYEGARLSTCRDALNIMFNQVACTIKRLITVSWRGTEIRMYAQKSHSLITSEAPEQRRAHHRAASVSVL